MPAFIFRSAWTLKNFVYSEGWRETFVWSVSEEIPPFDLDSAFVLFVHWCSRYLKQVTSDGVSFHQRMACSWWVLSVSKMPDE